MTKRREPLTYHRALTTIAARIGWDRCAAICGVTERTVRYWSDPDCETEIRLIDAERLDRAFVDHGGDHRPFLRLFELRADVQARAQDANLVTLAGEMAKESGEAIAATITAAARADCPRERQRAIQELEEAVAKMSDVIASLGGGHA